MSKLIKKISCKLGRHKKLYLIRSLSDSSDLIACPACNKKFAINYSVRLVLPWDRELEKFYEELDALIRRTPQ